jgi:hypothetical protein
MLIAHSVHYEAFFGNQGVAIPWDPICRGSRLNTPPYESRLSIKKCIAAGEVLAGRVRYFAESGYSIEARPEFIEKT